MVREGSAVICFYQVLLSLRLTASGNVSLPNGNRLTRTVNSVTEDYVYDDADKLLEVKIGQQTVKEFTYDSAGRTTAVETSAGTTSLTYDYESRVAGITYPNQSTNSFTYNGLDTRVGMSDSGGSKTFLRDGVSVTSPVLSDGSADYTPAISERRSSTTTFYHSGIKNGDSQSSTGQSVTASVQYDAFGNVTSSSGTWSGPFAYGGPYGYQSDPDSGLKLLGHRYYDSSTGRFLTRDPIKDGRNWYGYCGGNPTGCMDNSGLIYLLVDSGLNFILPGVSGSTSITTAFGASSFAVSAEAGLGLGSGLAGGPSFGLGIYWGPEPVPGVSDYWAIVFNVLTVTLEMSLAPDPTDPYGIGLPTGISIGWGPGEVAGATLEKRLVYTEKAEYSDLRDPVDRFEQGLIRAIMQWSRVPGW